MSSSPEIFNNSREAWFEETTNFDLALIRWNFEKSAELAMFLELDEESKHWQEILEEWPELAVDPGTGLMFAPGFPYDVSHRHFSHLMAIHPLNIIDYSLGEQHATIIMKTLAQLEKIGPEYWTGYSYSWLGNLFARTFQGEKAAETLKIFANCFCLKNSFHANGDQCKAGHSTMTYRPFTLEGNFAFAAGIQEMLIQSHADEIRIFPAIPEAWKEARFQRLRTRGGFLVSSELRDGQVIHLSVEATTGQSLKIRNPFGTSNFTCNRSYVLENGLLELHLEPKDQAVFKIAK